MRSTARLCAMNLMLHGSGAGNGSENFPLVVTDSLAADPGETPEPDRTGTPLESLTQREYEVFLLLGGGRNTRTVADMLGLSPKTVDVHRANIKVKLGLQDVPALIRQAVRWIETGRFDP